MRIAESNHFLMSKSELSPIEAAVQSNISQYFESSPHFIVAVSGGMDSVCLLHTFKELEISGLVAHINYQKRGEASDKDADLVEQLAFEWGFESHIATADPSDAEGENFQQWARDFRYDVFRNLTKEHSADGVAVAHHEDDQVETILQKIFRGAGLASWSGMQAWDGELFRPLLEISRAQIEQYVEKKDLPYRTDESNLESDFARNFLRNEWLPKLSNFFPGWKSNIHQVNEQAQNYEQAIAWIADRVRDEQGIKREEFHSLQPGVQKAVILHLLKRKDPGLEISKDHLYRVEELSDLQTGKTIDFNSQLSVVRDRGHYVLHKNTDPGFEEVIIHQKELKNSSIKIGSLEISEEVWNNPDFGNALYLDVSKVSWPITLRRWEHGDRFQPLGMEGHQQVSDHLTNRKINAAHKEKALVLESFEETICAIIFPPIKIQTPPGTISDQVKCDADTKRCLKVIFRN